MFTWANFRALSQYHEILNRKETVEPVGVDISSTSVKLLELSRTNSGYRIESYAVEPLPANAMNDKSLQDVEAVGEAVKRALKRFRLEKAVRCCRRAKRDGDHQGHSDAGRPETD